LTARRARAATAAPIGSVQATPAYNAGAEFKKTMMVREYKSTHALAKDANKLAKKGWELVSTTDVKAKSGGVRKVSTILLPIALFLPHSSHIVATFRKVPP
jgi:hypothetical protein